MQLINICSSEIMHSRPDVLVILDKSYWHCHVCVSCDGCGSCYGVNASRNQFFQAMKTNGIWQHAPITWCCCFGREKKMYGRRQEKKIEFDLATLCSGTV